MNVNVKLKGLRARSLNGHQ